MEREIKITNFYICSFLIPSEQSIQILNRAFITKHFKLNKEQTDIYLFKRRSKFKEKFETYFPNTLSILIDKKINTIKTSDDSIEVISTDIPLKYIKEIIVPENQILSNPLMYNMFLGKYNIEEYLSDNYSESEIYQMAIQSNKNTTKYDRQKYILGYYSALERMMSESEIYIPQFIQDTSNPIQLVKR